MTFGKSADAGAWNRALWLMTVLVVIAGWSTVIAPREGMIHAEGEHARELYETANANESKVRRAALLHVIQARVEGDLAQLAGQASSSSLMATTLRLLNDEAKRYHVEVHTVLPDSSPQATPVPRAQDASSITESTVSIGVRGRFRDIVDMVSDLPRHDVLVDVEGVDLSAQGQDRVSGRPLLDITLRVSIDRVRSLAATEDNHVGAPAR